MAVLALATAFLYPFFSRKIRPLLSPQAGERIWKVIWFVPIIFYFMTRMTVAAVYLDNAYPPELLLSAAIWIVSILFAYTGVLWGLDEANVSEGLRERLVVAEVQTRMQRQEYAKLQKTMDATRRERHDLRQHLLVLRGFLDRDEAEGASAYLGQLIDAIPAEGARLCLNRSVDLLARHYAQLAEEHGAAVTMRFLLPEVLPVEEGDFCVLLGNLLENAVEACERQKEGPKYLRVKAMMQGERVIAVTVKNSFGEPPVQKGRQFLSQKHDGEGIGTASVTYIAEKYNGVARFETGDHAFTASVMLCGPEDAGQAD